MLPALNRVQRESLQWQIEYYTNMILENPDWIFAGAFYDVGKGGLRKEGRLGLKKMLEKAFKDQIDYTLVKSILIKLLIFQIIFYLIGFIVINTYINKINNNITEENMALVGNLIKNHPDMIDEIVPYITKKILRKI